MTRRPHDAARRDGAAHVVDTERTALDRHEEDIDREAHPERMDRAATGDQEAGSRRRLAQPGEAEEPVPDALGDEQCERPTLGSPNVEDVHAVQAAHFQVKGQRPRNYSWAGAVVQTTCQRKAPLQELLVT